MNVRIEKRNVVLLRVVLTRQELSQIGMSIVKDTAALKNGDKEAASSWIVKVKITKNVPKSFVTTVTV